MESIVFPGIALLPTGIRGGVLFLNTESMSTTVRDQYVRAEIPKEVKDKLDGIGCYRQDDITTLLKISDDEPMSGQDDEEVEAAKGEGFDL